MHLTLCSYTFEKVVISYISTNLLSTTDAASIVSTVIFFFFPWHGYSSVTRENSEIPTHNTDFVGAFMLVQLNYLYK